MIQSDIEQLIKPLIQNLGYELWGCEYLAQGKHSLLRIYIDQEQGIGIHDCEIVSKQVSALLDVEDLISGKYSLEISSPGIPRPLFYKGQYQQYIGQEVQLKLVKPINGMRKLAGTIIATSEDVLTLQTEETQTEVQFSQIVKANLIGERGRQ